MRKLLLFTALILTCCTAAYGADVVFDYPGRLYTVSYKLVHARQWVIGTKKVTPLNYTSKELTVLSVTLPPASGPINTAFLRQMANRILRPQKVEKTAVYFDFDKANIKPEEKKKLDRFASGIKGRTVIKLTGYTDDIGTKEYNYKLGLRRAMSVKKYLQKRLKGATFVVKSKGKCCFVRDKKGHIIRRLSRRCEVNVEK